MDQDTFKIEVRVITNNFIFIYNNIFIYFFKLIGSHIYSV